MLIICGILWVTTLVLNGNAAFYTKARLFKQKEKEIRKR
jgi:hypothetical protein